MKTTITFLILCFLLVGKVLAAEQLGPVYPVAEPDMLEEMQAKLAEKERTGELAKMQKEFAERSEKSVMNPKPVKGITRTEKARVFYWDPSVRSPRTITSPDGTVLTRVGDKVNPLDYVSLTNHLLFFDARDPAQVKRALTIINHYEGHVKPILIGGGVIDLMRTWKKRIYFDQGGVLTTRFGIKHVPALVTQDAKLLRIDELEI